MPDLINLGGDNLAHLFLILIVEGIVLQLQDLRSECLAQGEDGTTSELREVNGLGDVLADLVVISNLLCLAEANLHVGVGDLAVFHHGAVAIDFEVALVGVDNDVVVLVASLHLGDDTAEALLEHAHKGGAVDVLGFLELCESIYEFVVYFLCHYCDFMFFRLYLE